MTPNPTVSIIVPTYRAADTIGEAIASIDAQTSHDVEVIIVDDASPDNTAGIVENLIAGRAGYRLLRRACNGGPAGTRNIGIAAATGDWLAFLDGDDAWLPHRLSMQLRLAEREPDVALWCGAVIPLAPDCPPKDVPDDPPRRDLVLREFVYHNAVATSTVLVRRNAVARAGGFDPAFVGPEDYDLWMRIAAHERLVRIECPLSRYRLVAGSLSMDDRRFLPQVLRVLDKAFGEGGALSAFADARSAAVGTQYWNASWMAFNRGARGRALQYWLRAYRLDRRSPTAAIRPWWRLLARYVAGHRETAGLLGGIG
jgi:glycosyltransferase involved in cell wall biosynthesis